MENHFLTSTYEILKKLKKINNQSENKIDLLKLTLIEYNNLIKSESNFKGFQVLELIQDIDNAKSRRVNVSKKYIHTEFLKIKEVALFRIEHNYSIQRFKPDKPESN